MHELKLEITKCKFERSQLTYPGPLVSTKGIYMDTKKVACVSEWTAPDFFRSLQVFLSIFFHNSPKLQHLSQIQQKEIETYIG